VGVLDALEKLELLAAAIGSRQLAARLEGAREFGAFAGRSIDRNDETDGHIYPPKCPTAFCRNWQNTSTAARGRDNNGARFAGSSTALLCSRPGRAPPRMHHRIIPARWAAMSAVLCAVMAAPCHAAPAAMETLDQAVCRP